MAAVAVAADPVAVAVAVEVAAAGPAVVAEAVVVEAGDPEEADKPGCQLDIMKNPANLMLLSGFF
jgi:hypothetical protein